MNEDDAIRSVQGKIEREKALINAANAMRQSTNNPAVLSRLDGQIREGRRNIEYLEGRARELQMRRVGTDIENLSLGSGSNGPPSPEQRRNPLPPPPKDAPGEFGDDGNYGQAPPGGYSQLSGGQVLMPPKAPYAAPGPGQPRQRANYSKLDLIKYDTPHLGPRIQLMLSQLEFKLSVEKQYKDGIEKMVRLYQMEGDRKSKADAEARRIESNQKIQLLKQALKRYEDLHVDIEGGDGPDDDSLNVPSARKPLTGHLTLRVHQVADVDHAATGRFSRGPETFVIMKVEDVFKGRTKATRNDRWTDEVHEFTIENANEVELTVYDRTGDHPLPIGMLWVRISDIAEEMRRKRIETELNSSSAMWVSADKMGAGGGAQPDMQFQPPPGQPQAASGPGGTGGGSGQGMEGAGPQPQTGPIYIDAWFALEPVGRIQLTLSFAKQNKNSQPFDIGLGRKGAIRQRKEEIHEQYGHKFVQQQFYNIMRCALCGDFLKYAAGMQCSDCKYTCHKKCYHKVVTKCITQSNAETDPDEAKLNHRIPHRFEPFANMGANWCCHCGYVLPFGKKQCRKCSECGSTCHANCVHFVPDFCGMSMEVANQILAEISGAKKRQTSSISSMGSRQLRPTSGGGPRPPAPHPSGSFADSVQSERLSYGKDTTLQTRTSYGQSPSSPTQQRPTTSPRTQSTDATKAAAIALGQAPPGPGHYQRSSTDYQPSSPSRSSGGYQQQPTSPQAQSPQQPSYNPADYAVVSGYPVGTYNQPPQQQQPPMQHPPRQSSYPQPAPPPTQPLPPQPGQAPAPPAPPHDPIAVQPPNQKKELPPHNYQGTGRRIGLDHFNFLAVLGKGNFGKVMLAETKSNKQLYAIKVLKKEFIIENDEVESTRSEKRVFLIANKERHPFLLNLHACFQTETRVYFVMEYVSGGDLMLHIQRGQFGTKRAQFYAAEVCLALKYFHENGVIYRDLKLDNILLALDGHIKIADYGLCKEDMWYGSTTSTFCGTPEFMAPEILLDKKYGRAVDWWAFGVLIYQMLLQQSPFRGEDEDEIYDAILADEPLYPIHMPRDSVSILQKLLTREPELRLGSGPTDAQEIMSHAFFRNINWEDVYHKRIPAPFVPAITSATDTSNFDQEFTSVTPVLTPVQSVLSQAMQEEFRGFSYSADFV
ncbi:Serine/threonine kinase [Diplodia seriata]|uniref:protein kinase C n=1 Tax=Diplodia seriata TaxID=420778 RepID=A0A1S8BLH7_9PEZI|nr:Protein kinase C-like [Diplodia seriata]